MKVEIKAAAKINLMLDLTSILPNGYHSIYTVMQSISIFDTVTVQITNSGKTELTCSDASVPTDGRNTAYKSAEFFFEYTGIKNTGIKIHIDKVIPSQAGMAGGSADAAAVIKALDAVYKTDLTERELFGIGEKVGADVPFCISGGTKLCLNKGEIMADLPGIKNCCFVVVKPDQNVSTKEAYAKIDAAEWIRHPDKEGFVYTVTTGDLDGMCKRAANIFEQVIESSERVSIKTAMRSNNAKLTLMTGSGSAVFGLFEKESDALKCKTELEKNYDKVFFAKPLPHGLYSK